MFLARFAPMLPRKTANLFLARNVTVFQELNAKVFRARWPGRSARMFQLFNAETLPKNSVSPAQDRNARQYLGSSAPLPQDKSAEMFQPNSARLLPEKSKGKSAKMFPQRNAVVFPMSSARMYPKHSVPMSLNRNAPQFLERSVSLFPDNSARRFQGSSVLRPNLPMVASRLASKNSLELPSKT